VLLNILTNKKEKLFKQTENRNGCLLWTGPTRNGYGRVYITHSTSIGAHRAFFMLSTRVILPFSIHVHHTCQEKLCVNIKHLVVLSAEEHMRLTKQKGGWNQNTHKTVCIRGHNFDVVNTEYKSNGQRRCRKCNSLTQKQKRKEK